MIPSIPGAIVQQIVRMYKRSRRLGQTRHGEDDLGVSLREGNGEWVGIIGGVAVT